MTKFCSEKNTTFCCSVSILLFVVTMLLLMVIFVWNYYFSLLNEMDIESEAVPILSNIIHYCNQSVQFQWNMFDCVFDEQFFKCPLHGDETILYYVESQARSAHIIVNNEWFQLEKWDCGKWIIWRLPVT